MSKTTDTSKTSIKSSKVTDGPSYIIHIEFLGDFDVYYSIPSDVMETEYRQLLDLLESLPPIEMIDISNEDYGDRFDLLKSYLKPIDEAGESCLLDCYQLPPCDSTPSIMRNIVAMYSVVADLKELY